MLYALLGLLVFEHAWVLWYLHKQIRISHAKLLVNNVLASERLKTAFYATEHGIQEKLDGHKVFQTANLDRVVQELHVVTQSMAALAERFQPLSDKLEGLHEHAQRVEGFGPRVEHQELAKHESINR